MTGRTGSFSTAFSNAFDVVGAHQAPPPIQAFMSDRPPTVADHAHVGDIWADQSVTPIPVWVMYSPNPADIPAWHLSAEFRPALGFTSSARLWEACLLYALRFYQIMSAPLGLAGGFDIGAVYTGRVDRDIGQLLKGFRGYGVPLNQEWPTLDDVKARLQMSDMVATTVDLQRALDAAIEQVSEDCGGSFGVGG